MRKRCLEELVNSLVGTLYVAAVPIGNKGDISQRVMDIAKSVSYILAEDTRKTGLLFSSFNIKQQYVSYHDFNDTKRISRIISDLKSGLDIMLVTDAGTPAISDPGYKLVASAREKALPVIPLPGACAAISALSVGGIPTDKFIFVGFLKKGQKRKKELSHLLSLPYTVVIYESALRIVDTLKDVFAVGGHRKCFIAREMTKNYEEYLWQDVEDLISELSSRKSIKGEIVLLIEGAKAKDIDDDKIKKTFLLLRDKGVSFRDSLDILSKLNELTKGNVRQIISDYGKI